MEAEPDSSSPEKRLLRPETIESQAMDGHRLVAQSLKQLGVTHVYCVSGTPIRETFAGCVKFGIRPIGVRNQQAGVMMAIAQNYITGRLSGVSFLSAGPAVTNAVTSVLVARDNCWPVVVLGGRRPLNMRGMGSFQELDAIPIFQSITKWCEVVESTSNIPKYLETAFRIAVSGRPGPVYLELPEDVLTGLARGAGVSSAVVRKTPEPNQEAIGRAVEILLQANRPAIVIGKGVRWSEPYQELQSLVDDFGIPFITSPMGRGYLPDDHRRCYNAARSLLQSKADVILLVGARLDWAFRFGGEFARDAKIIQIDIHGQEIGVNKNAAVGIVGDAKEILSALVARLALNKKGDALGRFSHWYKILDEEKEKKLAALSAGMNCSTLPMSPHRVLKEIRDFLPRDAICVLDGNVIMAAAQQVLPTYLPASRFTAGTNGCMGVGIPFAIGAKLAKPSRPVVAICGDTAFAFNAMEMETAVRHKIPVTVIVVNNEGISGALTQNAHFPVGYERVTMFQPEIHYEAIMRAFGGYAEFVEGPEQLRPALKRSLASGMAACINVKVDPNAPYPRD